MTQLSPELLSLQRLVAGRYSIERELGRGGMGIVFLARDVALDRPVAIKLLPPALSVSPESRERFLREARTAARLSHPHIVPIHAVESHDDLAFFVMAFIDGETLGERVRRAGPLSVHEAMRVTQEVAWALAHAHAHGVVHRDVKPDNILLERGSGRALVTDFGIAHLDERADISDPRGVAGTPRWMSPEQASGEPVDARSDIYALGLVTWYALTGRHPFEAGTLVDLRRRQMSEPPPALAPALPDAPPALARALDRALARDPADRFASADDLAVAVRAARGAEHAVAVPVRRFVADAEAAGGEIGTALTAGGVALFMNHAVVMMLPDSASFLGGIVTSAAYYGVTAIAGGLALIRIGQLMDRGRDLLRTGYGFGAVRPALTLAEQERSEEHRHAERAKPRSRWESPWVLVPLATAKTALFVWLSEVPNLGLLQLLGFVGTVAVPTVTIRKLWNDARRDRPGLWSRVLGGRLGRWLFRVAGLGLGDRPAPVPVPGEPTALAVGHAAGSLFDALSAAQRSRLGEVPRLIERLEAEALALRASGEDPRAAERLATVVAALDTLRLDLLRLHAGTATVEDLTLALEAVRRVGEEVDARLEVDRILEASPSPG